jgi:predicted ATPase
MAGLIGLGLHGLKTIKDLPGLELRPLNVLIGANGAGKSNLLSFFRLLHAMSLGELQFFVARHGGANALFHDGAAVTPEMSALLEIGSEQGAVDYEMRLAHAAPDTLIFADERLRFRPRMSTHTINGADWRSLGVGQREARVCSAGETGEDEQARTVCALLRGCRTYQFHNTSETARVRQRWDVADSHDLKEDGANLAPFLLRLREGAPRAYRRIVETVRQVVPFFADFVLEPTNGHLLLQWRERGTDVVFGAHQAPDGALRTMALIALLLQPAKDVPAIVLVDEPELGLHPYAISLVAGLLKSASVHKQVIVATQSPTFLNYFEPEDVVVVNRRGRESEFVRLSAGPLEEWLEEYSLAELWEKNVLGGRPHG